MRQAINSGHWDAIGGGDSTPRYADIIGGDFATSEDSAGGVVSSPGTFRKLRIQLVDNSGNAESPGSGKSYTFTLMKNQVATSLAVTISDSGTSGSDTDTDVSVVAGDRLDLRGEWAGTPTVAYAMWALEFEGSTANESLVFNQGTLFNKAVSPNYSAWGGNGRDTTEANVEQVVALDGTIRDMYVNLRQAPDPGDIGGYVFTVKKNGVTTSLTVTITGDNTTGNDTSNTVSVVAGDRITILVAPFGPPDANVVAEIGTTFVADTNHQAPLSNGAGNIALNTASTAWNKVAWFLLSWTDEVDTRQLALQSTLRNLYVRLSAAPGAGKSWVFTVRKNGADTNLSVTISGTDTTGNDTSNSVDFSDDDYMTMQCTPSGTPAAAHARWGVYQVHIAGAPTVTTQANTDTIAEKSTGHGNITSDGGASITQHGHVWSTSPNPTTANDKTENGAAPNLGQFQSAMTGLTPGTTYYVRASATNSNGTGYGNDVTIGSSSTIGRRYWWVEEDGFHYFDEWGNERILVGIEAGGIA